MHEAFEAFRFREQDAAAERRQPIEMARQIVAQLRRLPFFDQPGILQLSDAAVQRRRPQPDAAVGARLDRLPDRIAVRRLSASVRRMWNQTGFSGSSASTSVAMRR